MWCSLHRSRKLYIHAVQAGNPDNAQVLGLGLNTYLMEPELGEVCGWDDVLCEQEHLYSMFMEYICWPLLLLSGMGAATAAAAKDVPFEGADNNQNSLDLLDTTMDDVPDTTQRSRKPLTPSSSLFLVNSELEQLLSSAPPGIMASAILATTAAATTAVLWAWRR